MIASLGDDVDLNRWPCLLEKPLVLLGRRVWSRGLSDLCSSWSWLMGWDHTLLRSPSCDPFCPAPRIESRTSGTSAQPRTIETVNVTNGYKHGRYYACGVVLEPAEALDPSRWPKGLQVWGRKLIIYGLKLQQRGPIYSSPRSSALVKNGCHYYAYSLLHTFWIHSLFNPQFDRSSVYCLYQ